MAGPEQILVLSGRVKAGKSTLAESLKTQLGAQVFKSHDVLLRLVENDRARLQAEGERLDAQTAGAWVVDEMAKAGFDDAKLVVVDAVRIPEQIENIRAVYGRGSNVLHVHLEAPRGELAARYAKQYGIITELKSYDAVAANPTESRVDDLAQICDVLVDTKRSRPEDVFVRVAASLGAYVRRRSAYVDVLIGAQWGSEGKGHIAWHLAREYDVLVRVGGPNAGHSVIDPRYTFHLLPSGSGRNESAKILIGPGATIDVAQLFREINDCSVSVDRLAIDPQVMIIEDEDREIERELTAEIGSTGSGSGSASARRLMRGRIKPEPRLASDVDELKPYLRPIVDELDAAYAAGKRIFLEGTQGSGLSLYHGDYPHVTSRDTNVAGTLAEAGIAPAHVRRVIMTTRTYPIRVQSPPGKAKGSGVMPQELSWKIIAERSGLPAEELSRAEHTSTTKKPRRVSEFDWYLFRRSCSLNAPTDIALMFADYFARSNRLAKRYEQLSAETLRFIDEIQRVSGAPVSLISTNFTAHSIIDRRSW